MPTSLDLALETAIATYQADGSVPGLELAVTDRQSQLFARTGGWRDVAARIPVTPSDLFEIGSIGKTFTALVVLQLAREGRLAIDDPVVRHLPWFRVPRYGERITLHHLLSHTAGITAGVDGSPEAMVQVWRLRDLPTGCAPGRRCHYSNVGYKALGLIIEAIEGASYPEVLQRRILDPLALHDSVPAITHEIRDRLAIGYEPARDDRPWTEGDPLQPATWLVTDTADGSVAATGPDLAAFLRFLMTDASGIVDRMSTPVPAIDGFGYGYGLMRREVHGRTWVGHGGGMVGFSSGMQWDPASGIGAVVLQNSPGHNPNALARLAVRMALAVQEGRDPALERMEGTNGPTEEAEGSAPGEARTAATEPTVTQSIVVGAYRSHDPWTPFFRVEALGDDLWLTFPAAPDGFDDEQPLVPMANGWYRVGVSRLGPERLRFDTVIDGRARRAWLSGWDYYRVDAAR